MLYVLCLTFYILTGHQFCYIVIFNGILQPFKFEASWNFKRKARTAIAILSPYNGLFIHQSRQTFNGAVMNYNPVTLRRICCEFEQIFLVDSTFEIEIIFLLKFHDFITMATLWIPVLIQAILWPIIPLRKHLSWYVIHTSNPVPKYYSKIHMREKRFTHRVIPFLSCQFKLKY